jgi:hypothetical protein
MLKNQEKVFYQEFSNMCFLNYMDPGEILRIVNVYFIVKGTILMKSKKDRSVVGVLGPNNVICHQKFISKTDP